MSKQFESITPDKIRTITQNSNAKFAYPKSYKLRFPVIGFCKYCRKFFVTRTISIFDNSPIDNCPICGGRHATSADKLEKIKKAWSALVFLILLLCAALAVLPSFFFLYRSTVILFQALAGLLFVAFITLTVLLYIKT